MSPFYSRMIIYTCLFLALDGALLLGLNKVSHMGKYHMGPNHGVMIALRKIAKFKQTYRYINMY